MKTTAKVLRSALNWVFVVSHEIVPISPSLSMRFAGLCCSIDDRFIAPLERVRS